MALSAQEQIELRDLGERIARHQGYKFHQYFRTTGPFRRELYAKHVGFFRAGERYKERLFMAANRVGKSETGAYEVTCHLTGLYPSWWEGRRFNGPTEWWACGTTSETLRDIVQTKLFGPWEQEIKGGGMVPDHLIVHTVKRPHGLPGSIESAWVQHVSGGRSVIGLKMYEQGRKSFEGTAKHGCWCDEEPPEDCYTEMLYRTATTKGITMVTFTPLQGMSSVVKGFLQPETEEARQFKTMIQAGWDDVPHLDEDEKKALIATTPPFQREARTKGTPQLGSGAIYGIPESDIKVADFEIPKHWPRGFGMDAGGGSKPTAAAWGALDRDTQTLYIYSVYRRESPEIAIHLEAIKSRGPWIPGVGDCAALIFTDHDSEQLISAYRRGGLDLELPDKAVETGIQDVWELMSAGRFKVFASCAPWFEEFRLYHRDEKGRIVKIDDHIMDATRYLVRTGRARMKTPSQGEPKKPHRSPFVGQGSTPGTGWMS
jgi:phage terminase large subunit-like protein